MSTFTSPEGVTERSTLPGTSLNQRTPSGLHTGPSVNMNPVATFSMLASLGTRASNAGSSRIIFPMDGVSLTGAGGGAMEQPARNRARDSAQKTFMGSEIHCLSNMARGQG